MLLKPVEIEQLQNAVKKVIQRQTIQTMQDRFDLLKENYGKEEIRRIALPKSDGLMFVDINEISMIEADGAYSNVWLKDKSKVLVSKKLRFFEEVLASRRFFFRTHRSYLANINYIEKYIRGENMLKLSNGQAIPISRDRKSEFEDLLKDLGLSIG